MNNDYSKELIILPSIDYLFRNDQSLLTYPIISFHYISENEANLLYTFYEINSLIKELSMNIINKNNCIDNNKIINKYYSRNLTLNILYNKWPKSNNNVGDYSRILNHPSELFLLHKYLFKTIQISYLCN